MGKKTATKTGSKKRLTPKREKFVERYLSNGGNGKKAAEDAGFAKGHSAESEASRLLRNAEVQERIKERQAEAQVETNEIIGTLVSHMRADVGDIIPDNPIVKAARKVGKSHLIKKLVIKKYWDKHLEAEVEETMFELHGSQSAAKQLCAVFGLNKEDAKNPYDAAKEAMRELIERFHLSEESARTIVAEQFNLEESQLVM